MENNRGIHLPSDIDMNDENNPAPIDARLRRTLEPLHIVPEGDSEPMDQGIRPVATVAPLSIVTGGEMEDQAGPAPIHFPVARRKVSEVKSAYQKEEEDDLDCLSMADQFKGRGYLRLDLTRFSEFCRGEPEKTQRTSKSVWVRGLPWRILAIPRVERDFRTQRSQKSLGFFLQCNGGDITEGANWNCVAHAMLTVLSKVDGVDSHTRRITHTFYPKENDWGYSTFMSCDTLLNPSTGYISNDTVSLAVHVQAEAPHGVSWDSRKHTGFVGLKNQGATCYMNSILQTLFFTNSLRKAVYQMSVSPEEDPENSVSLAMQRVFYDLSHSDEPVGTKKLTKSFGWDSLDSFLQHDVQELCRVLLDNLETKMKGTPVEDMIPSLFKGRMSSYIKCTEVDFESAREEIFYDVQLNIRSRDPARHNLPFNILDSFRDYVEAEKMDGENKYDAGEYGLQPALKGVRFVHLPPILQFQLMRFQYDPASENNVKVNDRFEFTDLLDLNEFIQKNDEGIDFTYYLHAVLVHSGDFHGGHYVVYINTDVKGKTSNWCKFDDDVVSKSTFRESCVANFGGEDPEVLGRIFTSAYMLVYVRKDKVDEVLCDVTDDDIPQHLKERFEQDRIDEELKRKEKMEAHLYMNLFFITDDHLRRHMGYDLFDQKILELPGVHRKVEKTITWERLFGYVQNTIIAEGGVFPEDISFRMWQFHETSVRDERQHLTSLVRYRANEMRLLTEENKGKEVHKYLGTERAVFYIERPSLHSNRIVSLSAYNENEDILVYLKYFDNDKKELSYVGTVVVNIRASLMEAHPEIMTKMGFPHDVKLRFYEEVSPEKIKVIESPSLPICSEMMLVEVNDGCVIIFERIDRTTIQENAKTYLDNKYNWIDIDIMQNEDNNQFPGAMIDNSPTVQGKVDLTWSCLRLSQYVGERIGWDPTALLLWRLSPYMEKPTHFVNEAQYRHSSFRVRELLSLVGDALHDPRKNRRYKVYYNKLPITISELEKRKQMRVSIVDEKFNVTDATVFPDKNGTVKSILDEARRLFKFSANGTGKLRLVLCGSTPGNKRVLHIFHEDEPLAAVSKTSPQAFHLRVEEIPVDQQTREINELLIGVAHYDKSVADRMFGVPFYLKLTDGETYRSVRDRIRQRLDISEKEIEKYKFCLMSGPRMQRNLDMNSEERVRVNDIQQHLKTIIDSRGFLLPGYQNTCFLGLDHFNRERGKDSGKGGRQEKAIVIHN